jgi:hypothetical protein
VMVYAQAGAPAASPFPKVTILGSQIRNIKSTNTGRENMTYIFTCRPTMTSRKARAIP